MNENLQTAVTAMIEKSLSAVDTASTFLAAEIPDVVQQLLLWHGVRSFVFFLIGVVFLCGVAVGWIKLVKLWKQVRADEKLDIESKNDRCFYSGMIAAVSTFGVSIALPTLLNLTWLQILIAPKVWLIEYAANLVK